VASSDYSGWRPEPLPSPWVLVSVEGRPALESELMAEVSPGHPLSGYRRISVHLTWRGAAEQPPWPRTEDLGMPLSRSLAAHVH
jgi:hypothetical protein